MLNTQNENATPLARFFNKQREIIEAAETPFAKLAVFVLPILAPIVPASMTGLHMYKLFLELFTFSIADRISFILSGIIALVLEILGYVGAISFIQSLFKWVKERKDHYVLPFVLNGTAYVFYLIAMFLINVQLGLYFKTPSIVNNIIGLLSFITVPTSLLAANHLSQREEKEDDYILRQEKRQDSMKRYELKHKEGEKKDVKKDDNDSTSEKAGDWRRAEPNLTHEQLIEIINWTSDDMKEMAKKSGKAYRTFDNWKGYARKKLFMDFININNRFPSGEEIKTMNVSPLNTMKFIAENQAYLLNNKLLDKNIIKTAIEKLNSQ